MQPGRKTHKYSSWTPHMKRDNGKLWSTCSENTVVLKVYVNKKLQNPPFCARLRKKSCSLQCKVTSVQPCVGESWQRSLTTWRVKWKFLRFQLRVVIAQQFSKHMETVKLRGSLSTLMYRRNKKENEAYLYPQVANGNKSVVFSSFVVSIPLL
jgi:hypothetical protein